MGRLLVLFFNDTATTEIYTLSLHDALPISPASRPAGGRPSRTLRRRSRRRGSRPRRSEEHTSELQSPDHLVCRLLLEQKKQLGLCPPLGWPVQRATEPRDVLPLTPAVHRIG